MKILLIILLTPLTLLGQILQEEIVIESPDPVESYSKEEDAYNENHSYQDFTPPHIEIVKNHRLKHVKILSSADTFKHEINDSNTDKIKRDMEYLDPKNVNGSVKRNPILKYSNTNGTTVAPLLDSKYDEFMWG